VLTTDPWLHGAQYFGSWTLPYRFTPAQQAAFAGVRYVWLSHGHPDHLNLESLATFRDKTLLVADHRGNRILNELQAAGYRVQVLANNSWTQLSPKVRVLCCADRNQDAALLVALGDRCAVLNLNDGTAIGNRLKLKTHLKPFARRFVLRLLGGGGADMMNYFTEDGQRIEPMPAERTPLGLAYSRLLRDWDGTHTAPFSCHHAFARTDSRWAAEYETPIEAHGRLFKPERGEFIPGYFSYDVATDRVTATPMVPVPYPDFTPYVAKYGDNGRAFSVGELHDYFQSYREQSGFQEWLEFVRVKSTNKVRSAVLATLSTTPLLYRTARSAYRRFIA